MKELTPSEKISKKVRIEYPDKIDINKWIEYRFDLSSNDPSDWYKKAVLFRRVAEEIDIFDLALKLDTLNAQNNKKEIELIGCAHIYKFLMGISFENLLKAMIIAHGKKAGNRKRLDGSFAVHSINKLITQVDPCKFTLTNEEKNTLLELEKFVVWAGRYPVPRNANDFDFSVDAFDSFSKQKELALWKRFYEHLSTFPTIQVINTRRVPFHSIIKRWFGT